MEFGSILNFLFISLFGRCSHLTLPFYGQTLITFIVGYASLIASFHIHAPTLSLLGIGLVHGFIYRYPA